MNASEPPTNDTLKGDPPAPANEPSANITAASARYQNDFVTFTMKLEKGDGLSDPGSLLFWVITESSQSCCLNFVSLKQTTSGLQIVMGNPEAPIDPKDASQKCSNSSLSYDVSTGEYIASVAASCISPDAPPSFMWAANRRVPTPTGEASDSTVDSEQSLIASTVTNAKVGGYWAIGSDGKGHWTTRASSTPTARLPSAMSPTSRPASGP